MDAKSRFRDGYVRRLAEGLAKEHVAVEAAEHIIEGGEALGGGTTQEERAQWMAEAMRRMDTLLDESTRRAVRERCACCLGGKRHKLSQEIARDNETLEARIRAANETPYVFGHSVSRADDGRVLVSFMPDGWPHYGCACLRKATEPISITYCHCCGGHVKRHLQTALGRKVEVAVQSSALSSGGNEPCRFLCRIVE
jgi:hypothetical protein